tara:strand:+ start:704 stop:835 length:132 start_codon:yes stop_codon:yes gene_type:complete
MGARYIKFGMNKNRQNKDSMLLVIIGYVALAGLILGAAIGRLL